MPRQEVINEQEETLDRICGVLEVYQARRGYRFGIEALLLSGFVRGGVQRALDLGSGSGIIPMVLTRFGKAEHALGLEIQETLVERSRRTIAHNRLEHSVEIHQGDLRVEDNGIKASDFDLVTSNPPYGPKQAGHQNQNQEKAIARHEVFCVLEDVVKTAGRVLKVGGSFCAVVPPTRLVELTSLCVQYQLCPTRLRLVHGRIELAAKHCLVEACRHGKSALVVEPPLVIYQASGEYTPEVQTMMYPSKQQQTAADH